MTTHSPLFSMFVSALTALSATTRARPWRRSFARPCLSAFGLELGTAGYLVYQAYTRVPFFNPDEPALSSDGRPLAPPYRPSLLPEPCHPALRCKPLSLGFAFRATCAIGHESPSGIMSVTMHCRVACERGLTVVQSPAIALSLSTHPWRMFDFDEHVEQMPRALARAARAVTVKRLSSPEPIDSLAMSMVSRCAAFATVSDEQLDLFGEE